MSAGRNPLEAAEDMKQACGDYDVELTQEQFEHLLTVAQALGPKVLDAQAQERARKMRDTATFD
jgi:hypothetical protein